MAASSGSRMCLLFRSSTDGRIRRRLLRLAGVAAALALVRPAPAQTEGITPRWVYSAGRNAMILSSPALGPDHAVYFGVTIAGSVETGLVVALTSDGANKWSGLPDGAFATSEGVESSPALSPDGGTVYVGCNNGVLYALSAATGAKLWEYPTGFDKAIYTSPAVAVDGTIYVGSSNLSFGGLDSTFYAVSPAGKQLWAKSAQGQFEGSPSVGADGTIYYGTLDHIVYAVNPDGSEKWRRKLNGPIYASPAIAPDGTVFIGSDANEFFGLRPADGGDAWIFGAAVGVGAALGPDDTVYLGTIETQQTGKLYAVDRFSRLKPGWPRSLTGRILTVPAVRADGTILFGCEDNYFYALNPDGTEKWRFNVGDDVNSSPAIDTDGSIYFGSSGGRLYKLPGSGSPLSGYSGWPMARREPSHRAQAVAPVNGGLLVNLATRGSSDPAHVLIAGVGVKGSEPKPLLVRGVGPTLKEFAVAYPLSDPVLNATFAPFRNNDWGDNPNPAEIADTAARVGAFALPMASRDAAILATVEPEATYTSVVESADGGSGVALAEIYDADARGRSSRLINLSARGFVGAGENILIPSLVIDGPGKLRVLVRAVGPGLTQFGVSGVLARPSIAVYRGDQQIGANTRWTAGGIGGDIAGAGALVGAFELDPANADSALILLLDPAAYTFQVSGEDGQTGVALVEVYALPH